MIGGIGLFALGARNDGANPGLMFLGLVVLVVGTGWFLIEAIAWGSRPHGRVDLHEHGLVLQGLFRSGVIVFDDVDGVLMDVDVYRKREGKSVETAVTLVDQAGRRHVVPADLNDLQRLHGAIDRTCITPLISTAKIAFARGETLTFGPIAVDRDGVETAKGNLAWRDVQRVRIGGGKVSVLRRGGDVPWTWARLRDVPYVRVLGSVLQQATTVENVD